MRGGAERARQGWQVTLRIPHHGWCLILPSHHAVTLKGLHTYGTHIDVWACDMSMCGSAGEILHVSAPLLILPPTFALHYLFPHVSFSLKGPDVTACFP